MKDVSLKTWIMAFFAIFVLSRIRHIKAWLSEIFNEDMLSLEPIRDFPDVPGPQLRWLCIV